MLRKLLFCGTSAVAIMCASSAYAATFSFGFTGEVESGTIETSGTYELRLRGADGGAATGGFSFDGTRGGFGALLIGEVDLFAGDLFSVLVGGTGASGYDAGGGGGLSYFSSGANLAIAGGGGGASGSGYFYSADRGGDASGADDGFLGGGGSDSEASFVYSGYYYTYSGQYSVGGGGAGWLSNGQGFGGGESRPGWAGGSGFGGFGGGGGYAFSGAVSIGGGGAGAYGGDSGSTTSFIEFLDSGESYARYGSIYGAGGGASYFSSSFFNTASVTGQARAGGAYLTLELLTDPAPVPLPASAALLGSTILGMGFAARRRRKKS